jgi:hypothetical protein
MASYYFHLRDGVDILLDLEGRDLAGIKDVMAAALHEAREIISHDVLDGHIMLDQRIDVEDGDGKLVHRQEFADAVAIHTAPH